MTETNISKRRLAVLKTEVDLDFEGLIPALEAGQRLVLITDRELGKNLDPDVLRRIGGMVMLCHYYYGAAVLFVNESGFMELNGKRSLGPEA